MYNDKLVYRVSWVFFGISLWKEKKVLINAFIMYTVIYYQCEKA